MYYGKDSSNEKRMQCRKKGKNIIGVLLGKCDIANAEHEVMDVCISSFLKRPTTNLRAINVISNFINNIIYLKQKPGNASLCTASFLFISNGKMNCNVSGAGNVLYFTEDEVKVFDNANNQELGMKPSYVLEVNNEHKLHKKSNAFLLCTDELLEQVNPEKIKSLLEQSGTPDIWMKSIIDLCNNKDVPAMALILKGSKGWERTIKFIISIIPLVLLIGWLIWRLG